MKLVYPAFFSPWEDGKGLHRGIPRPSGAASLRAAPWPKPSRWRKTPLQAGSLGELEDGNPIPVASVPSSLSPAQGDFVSMVVLDMDAYTEKYGKKAVRKNLTIPPG